MENQNDIEFDLLQMVRHLLKRIWIILLATAVFAVGGFVISKTTKLPQYTTSCRIYVYDSSLGQVDYTNLVIATQVANDCEVLITGVNVTEPVAKEMHVSAAYIQSRLAVSSVVNTRILTIEFTDTDPQRAADILNKVAEVSAAEIKRVMQMDAVNTVYKAKVPTAPSSIPTQRDTLIAAAIGAVLSIAVLIVLFLMDDTIRSEDDVQRYLGLSTLAAIPVSEDLTSEAKPTERKKKNGIARFVKK